MLRGINRQSVFMDDEDNEKFLQTLEGVRSFNQHYLES